MCVHVYAFGGVLANHPDLPVSMAEVTFWLLDLAREIEIALFLNFASVSKGGDEMNEKQRFSTK